MPPLDLIERYLEGELTSADQSVLEEWLRADREHLRILLREIHLYRGMRELRSDPEAEEQVQEHPEAVGLAAGLQWLKPAFQRVAQGWVWASTATAMMLMLGLFVWHIFSRPDFFVASNDGFILQREGSERFMSGKVKLQSGDIIRTAPAARAVIQLDRAMTQLEVGGGTTLAVQQQQGTKVVRLDLGTIYGAVTRQRFGDRLQFITPQAQATVLGTDLKILTLRGRTELEVYSGKVYLARTDGVDGVQVNAGYAGLVTDSQRISQNRIPSGSGSVQTEYWLDIPGTNIADLTSSPRFATKGDEGGYRNKFDVPHLWRENYGGRVRGYLHPPRTGSYTFWVSGDDAVELWLSLDDQAETKQRICYTTSFTSLTDWEKHQSQQSQPMRLIGGRKYYIEALLKQAGGNSGLAVAWTGPGLSRQIIPGACLSPLSEDASSAASGH